MAGCAVEGYDLTVTRGVDLRVEQFFCACSNSVLYVFNSVLNESATSDSVSINFENSPGSNANMKSLTNNLLANA